MKCFGGRTTGVLYFTVSRCKGLLRSSHRTNGECFGKVSVWNCIKSYLRGPPGKVRGPKVTKDCGYHCEPGLRGIPVD
jgi:hypothetical protein